MRRGKGDLSWKFPNAFNKVLIRVSIPSNHFSNVWDDRKWVEVIPDQKNKIYYTFTNDLAHLNYRTNELNIQDGTKCKQKAQIITSISSHLYMWVMLLIVVLMNMSRKKWSASFCSHHDLCRCHQCTLKIQDQRTTNSSMELNVNEKHKWLHAFPPT